MASRSQTEQQQTSVDIAEVLAELANKIDRLKTLYEQYFMGIEKMEPQVARKEITRAMLQLQQTYIRNTALRFKFNTMLQKWNIYVTYWNRVLREIENGTYVRHVARAKRAAERAGQELPSEMLGAKLRVTAPSFSLDEETAESRRNFLDYDTGVQPVRRGADDLELEEVWDRVAPGESKKPPAMSPAPAAPPAVSPAPAASPAVSPAPAASPAVSPAAPPRPSPKLPPRPPAAALLPRIPGMNEAELRALHQRYVDAQRAAGSDRGVKYETLVQSLAKQVPVVLKQPGVKGVRFDVSVQDGKPILKAIPQK